MRRRDFFKSAAVLAAPRAEQFQLATFQSDITPSIGGPLFNNVTARKIVDPLQAHGVVLLGGGRPIVIAVLDWCEIRNDAYNLWRDVIAEAARTSRERVLLTCVHQHDAPYVDTEAQRLFEAAKAPGRICDPGFNEHCARKVAAALQASLNSARRVTHIGTGQAKVERVASNRRYVKPDGGVSFGRTSATKDPALRALPEGTIDPWLKTISFWEEDRPVAALSCYSTHPMSYYGQGDVSADFVGMARERRQKDTPGTAQIYLTGCSGDTIAGKYNDGSPANRPVLAGRMYQGMVGAWKATKRRPLENVRFRSVPMHLAPRATPGFSPAEMRKTLADHSKPYLARAEAALGLSWRKRVDAGEAVDVPAVDFGGAHLVLLPAEAFVQYQLWAQELRPDSFVMTAGFSESAPGYIPTAQAAAEGYDDHYSWVAFPECENTMRNALRDALRKYD
ncbi:MAG: hypothetical protein KJZ78_16435 [Bryobacteraceae bacterium]|nr:hypothetical protein [Bryobacteraceae bacterium]